MLKSPTQINCSLKTSPQKPMVLSKNINAILLDMNGTFMFGHDRFGPDQDYHLAYSQLGGLLSSTQVNAIIAEAHEFLAKRYVDENHFENFPSLHSSFMAVSQFKLTNDEVERLVEVFALHELGTISPTYAEALHTLSQRYKLAAVIDIWAPKANWTESFSAAGITELFDCVVFSSDQRMVKPSPKNFQLALSKLGLSPDQVIMVGDSARRDLGGAKRAGIECVLVGVERDPSAFMHFETLLEFVDSVLSVHTP